MVPQLAALAGLGAAGALAKMEQDRKAPAAMDRYKEREEQKEKNRREAEAEKKRESRGMKSGGKVSSASKRADGCAVKGKTRGKMV
jgi:Flp pilus assembly protein TadB